MKITELAYKKAIEVLKKCKHDNGFFASGLKGGYEAVWARDSIITSLGASLISNDFKKTIFQSIDILLKNQGEMGQIPNCVGSYNTDRQSDVTFNSIDSSLWFIIGNFIYAKKFHDKNILKKNKLYLNKTLWWLSAQDPDNLGLLAQQPTNDWQDAFPHKYGYVIHDLALYYSALNFMDKKTKATNLKKIINGEFKKYSSLYSKKLGYYYPWGWKNHDNIREHEEWFDTAGNLLAIITGLATKKISKNIIKYIEKNKINKPYPCKAIWPPIKKSDKEWHNYFNLCDARKPFQYLNAGVWPFIGSLYIVALVKINEFKKAEIELNNLAKANMKKLNIGKKEGRNIIGEYEFNEWLDGKKGKPMGEPYQAWSAGTYLYAYECVKRKSLIYF